MRLVGRSKIPSSPKQPRVCAKHFELNAFQRRGDPKSRLKYCARPTLRLPDYYAEDTEAEQAMFPELENTAHVKEEVVDEAVDYPCSIRLRRCRRDIGSPVFKADKGTQTFVRCNQVGTQTKPMPQCVQTCQRWV